MRMSRNYRDVMSYPPSQYYYLKSSQFGIQRIKEFSIRVGDDSRWIQKLLNKAGVVYTTCSKIKLLYTNCTFSLWYGI